VLNDVIQIINAGMIPLIGDARANPGVSTIERKAIRGLQPRVPTFIIRALYLMGAGMDRRFLAYLMQGLILATTVWSYFKGDLPVTITGALAFGMTLIPIAFGMKTHIIVPWGLLFCIALSLFLHVGGYAFNWYDSFYPYYDKVAHFVSSFTVALLGFLVILFLSALSC
jgi:hypothetical protein